MGFSSHLRLSLSSRTAQSFPQGHAETGLFQEAQIGVQGQHLAHHLQNIQMRVHIYILYDNYIILYYYIIILYYITLYYIILYNILYYITLHYIILYIILYYNHIILYYMIIILYYIII